MFGVKLIMFVIGFSFSIYLGIDKLFLDPTGRLITDRPQFYIALACMIIGSQLFLAGFLGELFIRTKKQNENYVISEVLNTNAST